MTDAIIAALIAAAASLIGQLIISRKTRAEDAAKQAARDQKTEDKLQGITDTQHAQKEDTDAHLARIERKLDEHNNYAQHITAIETDIRWLKDAQGTK